MSDEQQTGTRSDAQGDADARWYSNETATFGDRLADARAAVGMSQEELARRLGVKLRTLDNWENDLSEPRANRLSMLSGLLNVSFRWLLTGEGEGLTPPEPGGVSAQSHALLADLRQLRSDMLRLTDRLGHIEKQLKTSITETGT
ncbi:helix-turn-helix domain-containing protein [Profundibacterium mesophilum]|nr:helix-turn-helix transcriptional regulator [Profundibacterium mesophilum]